MRGLSKRKNKAFEYNVERHVAECLTIDIVVSFRQKYRGTIKQLGLDLDVLWRNMTTGGFISREPASAGECFIDFAGILAHVRGNFCFSECDLLPISNQPISTTSYLLGITSFSLIIDAFETLAYALGLSKRKNRSPKICK